MIFRNSVYAHRVVCWKKDDGHRPDETDHIDGNPLNNAWRNLRFGKGENQKNCSKAARQHLRAGWCCAARGPAGLRRLARMAATIHIGIYDTKEEAIAARKLRRLALAHPNHGRGATPMIGDPPKPDPNDPPPLKPGQPGPPPR